MFFREQDVDLKYLSSAEAQLVSFLPLCELDQQYTNKNGQHKRGFSSKKNTKERFNFLVDRDVLTWYQAYGPNFQTRMNMALRSFMENEKDHNSAV